MEWGKTGHKGINIGNIHVMSQITTLTVIPEGRPGRQFICVLRQ